jgi:hypothetical protein
MALPQAVHDVLNSLQIVGLPARAGAGDILSPQLSPGPLGAFNALADVPNVANLDLALNLDPSNLRFAGPTANDKPGDTALELVLKAVEFPAPAEKQARDVSTTATANGELPHLVPKPTSGVPPYTLEINSDVQGLLGKVTGLIEQVQSVTGTLTGTLKGAIKGVQTLVGEPTVQVIWRIEGKHALVSGTLTDPSVPPTFVILPEFAELTEGGGELTTSLRVFCDVSVTAQTPSATPGTPNPPETIGPRTIGPVEIQVPRVQLPSVLVMTEHAVDDLNFPRTAVLVAVPGTSAIKGLDTLGEKLRPLQSVLATLGGIAGLALAGTFSEAAQIVGMLIDQLRKSPAFIRADRTDDLSAVTLAPGGFLGIGGRSWEDVISALILVGPPGRTITCHNRRNLWVGTGAFRVGVGETAVARINNLNVDPATITPEPAGSSFGIIMPPDRPNYNDVISSFQFVPL